MIRPTVGRIVHYHPGDADVLDRTMTRHSRTLAAVVAHVWSDTCVNLAVFDSNGVSYGRTSVWLHQDEGPCDQSPYCEWMEYQRGQAAKTEQLEAAAAAK